MKENAGSVMPKETRRSILSRSCTKVGRLSRDQSREGESESRARRISSSTGSINHQEESENSDSWGDYRRRMRKREGGRGREAGERKAQLTNRPISRDDEVLRLIPSSQKPLRDSIRFMTEYRASFTASWLHRVRKIDGSF